VGKGRDCSEEFAVKSIDRSTKRSLISAVLILAACLILSVVVLPWDIELSEGVRGLRLPGDLRKLISLMELFAHGLGCVLILGTLIWVDEHNRRKLWLASGFVLLCGVLSNAAKYLIPRRRPYTLDEAPLPSSWETWGTPFTESWFDETLRSFPSGHTATAVAMAIGLSYVYPRGRYMFFFMALLASFQRLMSGAHYLSDILASVAMTVVLGAAWLLLQQRQNRIHRSRVGAGQE